MKVKFVKEVPRVNSILNQPFDSLSAIEDFVICYEDLRNMNLHKLFASASFDLEVVAENNMRYTFVDLLHLRATSFKLIAEEPFNPDIVKMLCSIFKDKAPMIRKYAMQGKSIRKLVKRRI